jgi:hypothetical protein
VSQSSRASGANPNAGAAARSGWAAWRVLLFFATENNKILFSIVFWKKRLSRIRTAAKKSYFLYLLFLKVDVKKKLFLTSFSRRILVVLHGAMFGPYSFINIDGARGGHSRANSYNGITA